MAVKVKIRYLAVLRGLTDEPVLVRSIDGGSLESLLRTLEEEEKPQLKARLFINSEVRPDVLIFINDTDSALLGGVKAELKDGDEVTFLPSVHGG